MPFVKRVNAKNLTHVTDIRKIFIGRTNELHCFVEHVLQPEDPSYNIVSISGEGGVGKSTLLTRFIDETCLPPFKDYCLTAFVNEQQTTPYTVMEKFATQLSEAGAPLLDFEKALTRYKETVHKLRIERETAQDAAVRETLDLVGTVAEEVPVVGGVLHKGANIITELYLQERRTRQMLKDAELLEDPLSDLTRVFVDELNRLTDKQVTFGASKTKHNQRVILYFDTFEQLSSEIAPWLLDHFLQANVSTNVVIVVAGRDSIEHSTPNDPKRWLPYRDNGILYLLNLNNFTKDETRAYLAERDITDPAYIDTIWQLSKGLPLYLGLLTFNLQGNVDPTADVVANFLRWIPEHEHIKRRLALDAAMFSKPFNQDDLTAFTYLQQEERATLYRWLTRLPFVRSNTEDGRYRYHDLAQEMFRRALYQRSQKEYYATRRALAAYYRQLLEQTLKEEVKERNTSTERLELSLALAYQLFYLPDEASNIEGIEQILVVYRRTNSEQDKEIARFLRDLPYEQQNCKMSTNSVRTASHLLQFVESEIEQQQQKWVDAINDLLKEITRQSAFPTALLAWLYDNRGHAYRDLKEYQHAIEDYGRAIDLDPTEATYHADRGNVYQNNLKEYQHAIEDYDRAIDLDPVSALYYTYRSNSYKRLKEYQRVIADLDKAIELDPATARCYRNRGLAYRDLKEYQHAIEDYDRAIDLDPAYAAAYNSRANAYRSLKKYQRAIEDYDRAIDLVPTTALYYRNRGLAYSDLKEYQHAIEDYDRAIDLDPAYAAAYNNRSLAYSDLKEYLLAVADLDKAIDLDPAYAAAYNNRGVAYGDLKEYQRAIEDYDRAIDLFPAYGATYSNRGVAYSELREYQRAIEDYDRAIDLDPAYAAVYNNRGLAYLNLKDYQRAIANLDKAIELDPAAARYYRNRGFTYYDLKEYQHAIEDYDRAIDLDPATALYYSNRGLAYCDLKEYQHAIADLDKAIDLDPKFIGAYRNRYEVYRLIGNYERALSDLDCILALNVKARIYNDRGLVLSYLQRYQEAIEDYERGLREKADDIYLLYNTAVVMARWQGKAVAEPYINRAREILLALSDDELQGSRLYGLGGLAALVSETDQALDYLGQALLYGDQINGWARNVIAWLDLRNDPRFQALISEI